MMVVVVVGGVFRPNEDILVRFKILFLYFKIYLKYHLKKKLLFSSVWSSNGKKAKCMSTPRSCPGDVRKKFIHVHPNNSHML